MRKNRAHLRFVARQPCLCAGSGCFGDVVAAHVRQGLAGGMGLKPPDSATVALCWAHHNTQHALGEKKFEAAFGVDMKAEAARLWQLSPHKDD